MTWRSGIRLVIFDFDGVIVDSEIIALDELRRIMANCGVAITLDETRGRFLGTSISAPIAFIEERTGLPCPADFVERWHGSLFARYENELRVLPGVRTLVSWLTEQSIEFCIASGGSQKRLAYALQCTDLLPVFRNRAFSTDLVNAGKPAPDIFLHAAAQFDVAAEHCLVVEDAPAGITAASSAGMRSVGFVGGSHVAAARQGHADLLMGCGATAIVDDHSELGGFLNDAEVSE